MTQREKDMRAEGELSQFLDRNFYGELLRAGKLGAFERITDVAVQKQGVDVRATTSIGMLNIDEKAQLHYINRGLPTFALELDFLLDGDVIDGWYLKDDLKTTHYFFLWPNASTTDLTTITGDAFTEVEGMLISKQRVKNYFDRLGLGHARLKEMARSIREQGTSGSRPIALDGAGEIDGVKLNASLSLREQPVNLVVNKRILRQLAGHSHYIITQQGWSPVEGHKRP